MPRMMFAVVFLLVGASAIAARSVLWADLLPSIAYFRPETWVWSDALQGMNISLLVGIYVLAAVVFSGSG